MKHRHHIIPKHAGGSEESSNIILLTIEEHAEAHKQLYERYGRWQDKIAWLGLSGRIGKEEIIRMKQSASAKATIYTPEKRQNMSNGQLGKKYSAETLMKRSIMYTGSGNNFFGKKHSEEAKLIMSLKKKGKPLSEETKKKMSEVNKGKLKPKVSCPHCHKLGGLPAMKRHHFDNCPKKIYEK